MHPVLRMKMEKEFSCPLLRNSLLSHLASWLSVNICPVAWGKLRSIPESFFSLSLLSIAKSSFDQWILSPQKAQVSSSLYLLRAPSIFLTKQCNITYCLLPTFRLQPPTTSVFHSNEQTTSLQSIKLSSGTPHLQNLMPAPCLSLEAIHELLPTPPPPVFLALPLLAFPLFLRQPSLLPLRASRFAVSGFRIYCLLTVPRLTLLVAWVSAKASLHGQSFLSTLKSSHQAVYHIIAFYCAHITVLFVIILFIVASHNTSTYTHARCKLHESWSLFILHPRT